MRLEPHSFTSQPTNLSLSSFMYPPFILPPTSSTTMLHHHLHLFLPPQPQPPPPPLASFDFHQLIALFSIIKIPAFFDFFPSSIFSLALNPPAYTTPLCPSSSFLFCPHYFIVLSFVSLSYSTLLPSEFGPLPSLLPLPKQFQSI
jgi:hypothetical protein